MARFRGDRTEVEMLRGMLRLAGKRSALWKMIKEEVHKVGHWKDLPRGNPTKGGKSAMRKLVGNQ